MKRLRVFAFIAVFSLILIAKTSADERLKPASTDKCPVCGMFVAKYPNWIAQIVFNDGSYAFFDGPKDMFKYYLELKKYNPSKKQSDIKGIFVTDYYSLNSIDATSAYYVIGSDVYGPMGRELIPFKSETDAKVFMKDHKGKLIMRFTEVTADIIKEID